MREETLTALEKDLIKDLKNNKRVKRNTEQYGYSYNIEYIPVLVERTKEGRCGEITFPQVRIIFELE